MNRRHFVPHRHAVQDEEEIVSYYEQASSEQIALGKATTDSKHNLPVARNLLDRQFAPSAPNQVWTSDITYWPALTQFSTSSAGTRVNSETLFVTSTRPSLRA